jgi:hypothetical protein
LRDIIFFLENNELAVGEYRRLCIDRKIGAIVEQDRVALKSYLTGEISSCPQIDVTTTQGAAPKVSLSGEITSAIPTYNIASKSTGSTSIPISEPLIPAAELLQFRLSRRNSKRKLIDNEGVDATFLEADKQELRIRRAGEIPAQTRATVLSKPGAVRLFETLIG